MGYAGIWYRVVFVSCEPSVNILESLKDGPKLYSELRGQTDAAPFDIQLGKLLRSRAIVRVYDYSGETAKFGLPPPPPTDDDPCLKIIQSKTLLTLKKKKNQYCFDKEGRKKCSACGKRKGRSRFMYAGKTWGRCWECSNAEPPKEQP